MKISPETIEAFKTLRFVSPRLGVKPGNKLYSVSPAGQITAMLTIPDVIPTPFGVYDLGQFLAALSMFKQPDIEFGEHSMLITGPEGTVEFWYSTDVNQRGTLDDIALARVKPLAEFTLSGEILAAARKAAVALHVDLVKLAGDGKTLTINAVHESNTTTHSYTKSVADTSFVFGIYIKADRLAILSNGDYLVKIINRGNVTFTSPDGKSIFMLSAEKNSHFNQ